MYAIGEAESNLRMEAITARDSGNGGVDLGKSEVGYFGDQGVVKEDV